MKLLAVVLIVLGIVGILYGGIRVVYPEKVVDIGPIQITADKHKTLPIPPILGAIALAAGVVVLVTNRGK